MGRTLSAEATIAELKKRVETAENYKKRLENFLQQLVKRWENREISYVEYEEIIDSPRDGKTIQQWFDYYDSYIEDCKKKIEQERNRKIKKKVLVMFLSVSIILVLFLSAFYLRPVIVGLIVKEEVKTYTQTLNLELEESQNYEWELENLGQLQSVKISGLIEEEGEVKIYLDDLLIVDSSELQSQKATITGGIITGFFAEGEEAGGEETSETTEPTLEESEESYSEETQEEASQEDLSPSQEEPPSSETEEEIPTEEVEEPTEEEPPTEEELPPQEEPTEEETPPEEEEVEEEITIKQFTDLCEETCDLSGLNLNKPSYTLKIQITNAKLNLDTIKYEIIVPIEEVPEEIPIIENVTEEIPIIKNITEEVNITITTQQYQAVIGQTVKWKKHIQLKEPGIAKVKLPKDAENIIVNKITGGAEIKEAEAKQTETTKQTEEAKEPSEEIEEVKKKLEELQEEIKELEEKIQETEKQKTRASITGITIAEEAQEKSLLGAILNFFRKIGSAITGRAISEEIQPGEEKEIIIDDTATEYEIEYETPAPYTIEKPTEKGKIIIIVGPDTVHYENVLAFTNLPSEAPEQAVKLYHIINGSRQLVQITKHDTNNNGKIDYIEWTVSSLSNQTYELEIVIYNAEHLNKKREFVANIYEQVNQTDDITYTIPKNEYVRAYFERNLSSENFIDIYVKNTQPATIEVYEKDSDVVIGSIEVASEGKYYISLNHQGSQDVFDFKSIGNDVIYDYIHDAADGTLTDDLFSADYASIEENGKVTINATYMADSKSETYNIWLEDDGTKIEGGSCVGNFQYDHASSSHVCWSYAGGSGCTCSRDANGTMVAASCIKYYVNVTWVLTGCSAGVGSNVIHDGVVTTTGTIDFDLPAETIDVTEVDSSNPNLTIVAPANNSNFTIIDVDVNYSATDETGLTSCLYSNNTGLINKSITCGNNLTTTPWDQGENTVFIFVGDAAGNWNYTSITFNVDSYIPNVSIVYPENSSNFSYARVNVNYTVYDANLQACYYSNSSGLYNYTITCGENVTTRTWDEGLTTVFIYANDSLNNINVSEKITFRVDTRPPYFDEPITNQTVSGGNTFNYDVNASDDGVGFYNYSVNDTVNFKVNSTGWITNKTELTELVIYWINLTINDSLNNKNSTFFFVNITVGDVAPQIYWVMNESLEAYNGPNAADSNTNITINFSVYDANGAGNLVNNTAKVNITMDGATLAQRFNSTCLQIEATENHANYSCKVQTWWWDSFGTWNITAYIEDEESNIAQNVSNATLFIGGTKGFEISHLSLSWPLPFIPGDTNISSNNDPIELNNTGNVQINKTKIEINATPLLGEADPTYALWPGNMSASYTTGSNAECWANNMSNGTYVALGIANLTTGNYTGWQDKFTGQEELYFCVGVAGSELTNQPYSTHHDKLGSWTIRILLVALSFRKIKKKKKQKSKEKEKKVREKTRTIKDDKLIKALDLIVDELKEEYSLNKKQIIEVIMEKLKEKYKINKKELRELIRTRKEVNIPSSIFSKELGGLEAITKYMKENLGMSYHEIAKLLNRDDRTIWTSYKKAKEKQPEPLKIKQTEIFIPISIFKNRKLTVLESIILYLKEKGLKHSEIAKLLDRDQRNIYTIYSRAVRKIKRKV